jgi:hypothetical protein
VKALERQIMLTLDKLVVGPECLAWAKELFERENIAEQRQYEVRAASRSRTSGQIERQLKNVIALRLRDQIDDEEFRSLRAELIQERLKIESAPPQANWLETLTTSADYVSRSRYWFIHGGVDEKKLIAQALSGSNLVLKDKKLRFEPVGPFRLLAKQSDFTDWRAFLNDFRMFCASATDSYVFPDLPDIPCE